MKKVFLSATLIAASAFLSSFYNPQHNELSRQETTENDHQSLKNPSTEYNQQIPPPVSPQDYVNFIEATPSLQGTDVDGQFEFDQDGNLIISQGIRYIFEYFFTSLGEQDLESIKQAVSSYAKSKLTDEEHQRIMELYDNYMKARAYNSENNFNGQAASTSTEGLESLQQHFYDLKQHRRNFLSAEEAEMFYAEEEAYDEFSINRMLISKDTSLSESEKQLAINTLEESLPESQRLIRHAINQSKKLDNTLLELRANNASDDEIYYARAQILGDEKAQRLRKYESQQALWNQRYQEQLDQQLVIMNSEGLSHEDKQQQITQMLQQNFSEKEIKEINRMQRVQRAKDAS